MSRSAVGTLVVGVLMACGGRGVPASRPSADTALPAVVPVDSLVLTLVDSVPVWLTPARTGTASDGTPCREFGVRVGKKLVPLLYVQEAPRLEGGILRAELSRDCRVVATYRIDPATAQPSLERGR